MKATCPKDKNHKQFYTTAHVVQEWKVNENGDFLEVATDCLEISSFPSKDNIWRCAICGSEAKVVD